MIYAKIYTYNGNQQCVITKNHQDDASWIAYDVPNETWLSITNNAIVAATIAPVIPKVFQPLSAWQVRKVLTQFGLRTQVENAIAGADQATKDAWAYANDFSRDNALLNTMGKSLGMTDAQLDQLFTVGITL